MQRVVVFGTTGSGKSWLAERLAARTGLRFIELDKLFWGPDWQATTLDLFRYRIENETRADGWIVAGNYGQVRDIVWRAADTLIWIDLPFPLVMRQLLRRTIRRIVTRENLWGTGNVETWRKSFFARDSILLWAINTHRANRRRFSRDCETWGEGKTVVRLRSRREIDAFIASHAGLSP